MGFYTIELPKMPKEIENMNGLLLWCKFINSESEEEFEMLATKNESIEVAYIELQRLSQDKEKRIEYEARQKSIRDHNHLINQFKQEGIKEGLEKGEHNKAISNARNFLSMGLSIEQVAKGTELSVEEVLKLKEELIISLQ